MTLTAAYGGPKWSERSRSFRDDLPEWWGDWGVSSECGTLRAVLLKRPGPELDAIEDFDAMQMRSDVLTDVAAHNMMRLSTRIEAVASMSEWSRTAGSTSPTRSSSRFDADDSGRGDHHRPASTIRAGEERFVAEALAAGCPYSDERAWQRDVRRRRCFLG